MRINSNVLMLFSFATLLSNCKDKINDKDFIKDQSGNDEVNEGTEIQNPYKDMNFLIIMTDQQRWDTFKAAGNNVIKTPNIDKLVSESYYFRNAVCPVPVSGPSRTSILTGRLMEKTKVTDNATVKTVNCQYESYDQILSKKGFVTEYYGKFHSPKNISVCYSNPSEYGMNTPEIISNWEQLYRYYLNDKYSYEQNNEKTLTTGFYSKVPYIPNVLDVRYDELMSGKYTSEELEKIYNTQPDCHGILLLDKELTSNAYHAKQTISSLNRLYNQKFALTCSFHCPHAPMLALKEYFDKYNVNDMPIPESIKDPMNNSPYKSLNGRLDKTEYSDPSKIKYMIADYYAIISEIDYWIGEIMNTLKKLNLDDKTIIIFMSDHGEMLGAHGMREKNNFLEESVRVPLVVRDPLMISSAREIVAPVSCINIFQTIMDYAGVDVESDGFSLRPIMRGESPQYDFAVSEWSRSSTNIPNLMVRTEDWKLIINTKLNNSNYDALYNLKEDPYEMNNLLFGANQNSKEIAADLIFKLIGYLKLRDYPYIEEVKTKLKQYQ